MNEFATELPQGPHAVSAWVYRDGAWRLVAEAYTVAEDTWENEGGGLLEEGS